MLNILRNRKEERDSKVSNDLNLERLLFETRNSGQSIL